MKWFISGFDFNRVSDVVDGLTVPGIDLCLKDLKTKQQSSFMQILQWFSKIFMLRYACSLSTFGLSFLFLPQRNQVNYVMISSHRKEQFFFYCLTQVPQNKICRLCLFIRGPEIVAIFGIEFTDEVCNNL